MKQLVVTSLSLASVIFAQSIALGATIENNWQHRKLLFPTAGELVAEQGGRITIYDGIQEETVDKALDTQFDRVERMMFIRVQHSAPDGGIYQDDDCD